MEQGRGTPVVFVHGAISDHRYWEYQRDVVAKRYRFIALDRRYFGTAPWPDTGVRISQATDADDLAAFIRALEIAPAFLVGISGGANVVLMTAVRHPEVVRAVLAQEPGLRSILTDSADRAIVREGDQSRAASRYPGSSPVAAHRCIPQSHLVTIPNAGHGAPTENPSAFNEASLAFLARLTRHGSTTSAAPPGPEPERASRGGEIAPRHRVRYDVRRAGSRPADPARARLRVGLPILVRRDGAALREAPPGFSDALLAFLAKH